MTIASQSGLHSCFKRYQIELPGAGTVTPKSTTETDSFWQRTLQRLHDAKVPATCTCPGSGAKRLDCFVRNGRYYIRRAPKSGPEHFHDCIYHSSNPKDSGIQGYDDGVIIESDGRFSVRLEVSLSQAKADEGEVRSALPTPSTTRPNKRSAMTLLGLLHFLWEASRLHTWHSTFAGKRTGTVLSYVLRSASKTIVCNKKNLDRVLVLLTPNDSAKSLYPCILQNREVLEYAIRTKGRVLVMLELPPEYASAEFLSYRDHGVNIYLPPESTRKVQARIEGHARAIAGTLSETTTAFPLRRMVIGIGSPSMSGKQFSISIASFAAMLTTAQYIPVESSYEWVVADRLIYQQRYFCKPMRYDSENEVFPDFILLDTARVQVPMEVFGMATESYLARKAEKTAYYQAHFGVSHHWLWDATRDRVPPPLPPMRPRL